MRTQRGKSGAKRTQTQAGILPHNRTNGMLHAHFWPSEYPPIREKRSPLGPNDGRRGGAWNSLKWPAPLSHLIWFAFIQPYKRSSLRNILHRSPKTALHDLSNVHRTCCVLLEWPTWTCTQSEALTAATTQIDVSPSRSGTPANAKRIKCPQTRSSPAFLKALASSESCARCMGISTGKHPDA